MSATYHYLQHRFVFNRKLQCSPDMFPVAEIVSDSIETKRYGFYVPISDGFCGAFSTQKGPMFFVNGNRFLFADPNWTAEIVGEVGKLGEAGVVEVRIVEKSKVVEFSYQRQEECPADIWSDPKSDDIYEWLKDRRQDMSFIRTWTDKT